MTALYYFFGAYDSDAFINCALQKFTGTGKQFKIIRPEKGRPYVEEKNLYFSLSHTEGLTVCAVSSAPVGVDAEKKRTVKNGKKLARRFIGKNLDNDDDFIREWTAFESRVKLTGTGIFSGNVDENNEVYTFDLNGYIISVCTPKRERQIIKERLKVGILNKADIMLPKTAELSKWSVVACDQYTSQPEYWNRVEELVGSAPSTLNLVYPEAYLSEGSSRIDKINNTMKKYIDENIFEVYKDCLIYVERTLSGGRVRRGIVGAIDLEQYDFHKGAKSSIRATEGTVMSRIPPRVKIRENAPLELPHIILLVDDPQKTIVEKVQKGKKLYDFELMENGGHLAGWLIEGEHADSVLACVDSFAQTASDGLVFAVGDGNHSLAAAKTCWDNLKDTLSPEERETHPARYCLAEIENIHDEVLEFEPIHRVVFDTDEKSFEEKFVKECSCDKEDNGGQHIVFVNNGDHKDYYMKNISSPLTVGTLQKFLDGCSCEVDYIHGERVVDELTKQKGTVGFLLPKPDKGALFETVIKDGALPRKTFSMGEANEKRFYMEAKKIR